MKLLLAVLCAGAALLPSVTMADGLLPPKPYRYLHPPPALASGNLPPTSGSAVAKAQNGRTGLGFAFTQDRQAGLTFGDGVFAVPAPNTGVRLTVRPVQLPAPLPAPLEPDGNPYSFSASLVPGGGAARPSAPVQIVFRWPRLPIALYQYRNGHWRQLCYSDAAVITPSTFACSSRTLGTFVAVRVSQQLTTPASSSSWLSTHLQLVAAGAVLVVALVLGYVVTRPRGKAAS